MTIRIDKVPEYAISRDMEVEIQLLLDRCFPYTFDGRTFYKQKPNFRLLYIEDTHVVGHVGVDVRVINVAGRIIPIFGAIDLCTAEACRSRGVGTQLLKAVERIARKSAVEFIVLMADEFGVYERNGYIRINPAVTRWLAIDDLKSHSIIVKDLSECFVVKPVTESIWPEGEIDMLGHLF